MTNRARGTLYVGATNNLIRRVFEHQQGVNAGFTKRNGLKRLVYVEETQDVDAAIAREKQIKNWHRQWKINLIESTNARWQDLAKSWGIDSETSSE